MTDEIKKILAHQANLESLWLLKPTIGEALLQAALRHLTAVLEGDPAMAKIAKDIYWDVESEL